MKRSDEYYNVLAKRINEKIKMLKSMNDEEREKYVNQVVDWIVKMFEDISSAMKEGGMVKASKVAMEYKKQLDDMDRKATAIACLIYTIKPQYQEKVGKLMLGVFGFV